LTKQSRNGKERSGTHRNPIQNTRPEILQKEIEGERKLHLQAIASLEAKINEKDALIAQLTKKDRRNGTPDPGHRGKSHRRRVQTARYPEYPEKERGQEKG